MCALIIIIDDSVMNSAAVACFSNCGSNTPDSTNLQDLSTNDFNGCCNTASSTSGYGITAAICTTECKFYYNYYIFLQILAI